ncbi:MAG: NlpC/P60 family protein [Lachnospiraceae bacterium]|nr:NlpC/P60 family protein [Lachnospiraceae bacterium]MDD3659097.1 NlpC/P60 family protein [Lachnospiraceae bacterium]
MNYNVLVKMGMIAVCMAAILTGTGREKASFASESALLAMETAGVETVLDIKTETDDITKSAGAASVLEEVQSETLWGYANLGIANVDNHLNIRSIAADDGKLVGKLARDAACEILGFDGKWAHIKSGNVEGYVSKEYLIMGKSAADRAREIVKTMATVKTDTLKVREQPDTDSAVVTLVPNGEELEVVNAKEDWVEIQLDDETAFIAAEFVEVDEKLDTAITMSELLYGEGVSDVRVDLCQYAKEFIGNRYVWGGTSLTNGADCSGFVLSVFKKYGVSLPHSSGAQAGYGTKISPSQAQPGDLFFYAKGGRINHVAIYIGNGQVVHASSPSTGIRISNAFYRTPAAVRRILQ